MASNQSVQRVPERFAFENALIVTGAQRESLPSDAIFAERGKPVTLGELPWNFEGSVDKMAAILLRASVTVPRDGWYALGSGADWWLTVWIDGNLVMDVVGNDRPAPSVADHGFLVKLTAGRHTVDCNYTRGTSSSLMALQLEWFGTLPSLGADLETPVGRVKPELHGSNTPSLLSSRCYTNYDEALRKLNFRLSRTHDWALGNPGQRIVDTHFIFPLMHLDPAEPANYCFAPTDKIIQLTQEEAEMEIFYRLGTSIEHTGDHLHFNSVPPEDFGKYAEVLAGIVRHYTRGWANGYRYNVRYWEIWNEPDSAHNNMWAAPYPTFIPFFVTVLKRLKAEFPELQIGGPAMVFNDVEKFRMLLAACKEAGVAPDFISWHRYTTNADDLIRQPVEMRKLLDGMGFPETKLCINEWHYLDGWIGIMPQENPEAYRRAQNTLQGIDSGVFNAAVISGWQYGPLDLGMWYGSTWDSEFWGYTDGEMQFTKNYYSMELVGRFVRDYARLCAVTGMNTIHLLAGTSEDGKKAGLLISDLKGYGTEIEIPVKGIEKYARVSAVVLDEVRNNEPVPVTVKDGVLRLVKARPGSAAFLVALEK